MTKPSENRDCPYCRSAIADDQNKIICPECGIAHHTECWLAHQSCSVYGCNGWEVWLSQEATTPTDKPEQPLAPKAPSPPEAVHCIKCGVEIGAGKMLCLICRKRQPRHYFENCSGPSIVLLAGFITIIVLIVRSVA